LVEPSVEVKEPAKDLPDYSSNSSVGSESEVEITGAVAAPGAVGSTAKMCRPTRKIAASKAVKEAGLPKSRLVSSSREPSGARRSPPRRRRRQQRGYLGCE
jgi:hypothetical protein